MLPIILNLDFVIVDQVAIDLVMIDEGELFLLNNSGFSPNVNELNEY